MSLLSSPAPRAALAAASSGRVRPWKLRCPGRLSWTSLAHVEIRAVQRRDVVSLWENCFSLSVQADVEANVERSLAQQEAGEGVSLVAVDGDRVLANLTVTRNAHRLRRHRATWAAS
jgi:hypothetical protein